jgi:hypothetical protein
LPNFPPFDVHVDSNVGPWWKKWLTRFERLLIATNITETKQQRALLLHISSVLKTIIKCTGLIAKLRHYTNRNTLKLIYLYALAYPYTSRTGILFGEIHIPQDCKKIMNVQKKIVRLICFKSYSDHSEPLFLDLKILNVYKINDYLYVVYLCIDSFIIKIICRTFIVIILNKIVNYTIIIHVIPPSYTWTFKELIIVNILCLTKWSLYGMVSMKTSKISNRILILF